MLKRILFQSVRMKNYQKRVHIETIILIIFIVLIPAISIQGQVVIGYDISGYVRSESGSGISGVSLTATGTGLYSGVWESVTTRSSGYYSIHVPDGFDGDITPSNSFCAYRTFNVTLIGETIVSIAMKFTSFAIRPL